MNENLIVPPPHINLTNLDTWFIPLHDVSERKEKVEYLNEIGTKVKLNGNVIVSVDTQILEGYPDSDISRIFNTSTLINGTDCGQFHAAKGTKEANIVFEFTDNKLRCPKRYSMINRRVDSSTRYYKEWSFSIYRNNSWVELDHHIDGTSNYPTSMVIPSNNIPTPIIFNLDNDLESTKFKLSIRQIVYVLSMVFLYF